LKLLVEPLPLLCSGVPRNRVGIVAVGCRFWGDGVNPAKNQNLATNVVMVQPTNLHPAVSQSPKSVVLAALYNLPTVLKQKKLKSKTLKSLEVVDSGLNASPATKSRAELVRELLVLEVWAKPMVQLLQRRTLIIRASALPGLPKDYPFQVRSDSQGNMRVPELGHWQTSLWRCSTSH
jgi:hypothetical protein